MTVKDIVALLLERGMALQTFWGFYISVALGLVAFFGSAPRSPRIGLLLSLAFVAFAWVNCSGMAAISKQRWFLRSVLAETSMTAQSPLDTKVADEIARLADPDDPRKVVAFHIASDVGVLVAIWILVLWPTVPKSALGDELHPQKDIKK